MVWNILIATYEQHGYDKEPITSLVNVIQPDEKDDPAYICMSNIYADLGMQEEANKIEVMRLENKA